MADFSIITLTRDHPEYVERLDESLTAALAHMPSGMNWEKILVNNGPSRLQSRTEWDATTLLARKRGWMVIEPGYNTSFSEGNNLGAKLAAGEYLLLLNDDLELRPESLVNLWGAREQADLVGMLIRHRSGTINHAGTKLIPWPDHLDRGEALPKCDLLFRYTEAVTFAAVLMRQELYQELEGLDERYLYGFEDTDFCCKALLAGKRIGVALNAVALHDECGTRVRNGGYDQENAQRYRDRWGHRIERIVERYWDGTGAD